MRRNLERNQGNLSGSRDAYNKMGRIVHSYSLPQTWSLLAKRCRGKGIKMTMECGSTSRNILLSRILCKNTIQNKIALHIRLYFVFHFLLSNPCYGTNVMDATHKHNSRLVT